MMKVLKIIGIISSVLILTAVIAFCYVTDFGRNNLFGCHLREPHLEIPITYNLGWWNNQNNIRINHFDVEILHDDLSLFCTKSMISYNLRGEINFKGHWKPFVKKVHVSERLNKDSLSVKEFQRIIELTPVVSVELDESLNGGVEYFEFVNEHIIESGNWGINKIKFVCGDKEKIIALHQLK